MYNSNQSTTTSYMSKAALLGASLALFGCTKSIKSHFVDTSAKLQGYRDGHLVFDAQPPSERIGSPRYTIPVYNGIELNGRFIPPTDLYKVVSDYCGTPFLFISDPDGDGNEPVSLFTERRTALALDTLEKKMIQYPQSLKSNFGFTSDEMYQPRPTPLLLKR